MKFDSSAILYVDDIQGITNGTNRLSLDDDTMSGLANGVSLTGVNTVYIACDETNNGTGEIQFLKGTDNDLDAGTAVEFGRFTNGGNLGIGETSPNGKLHIKDATDISMASTVVGQLVITGNGYSGGIAFDGSSMNIYHNSSARNLVLGTNETERFRIAGGGNIICNEPGADVDFRIETNNSTHTFFVDGGTDRIGIGTDFSTSNNPKTLLTIKPEGTCTSTTLSAAVSGGLSLHAGAGLDDNDFYPAISFVHDDGNTSVQNRTTAVIVARATEVYDDGNDCGTELEFYTKPKNTDGLPDLNMILEDDGDLHVEGDVVAFSTTTSDKKLKDNVVNIENPLDKITKLRGVEFDWNATSRKGQHDIGLIAQEVEKVIPDVVREKPLKTGDFANNEKTYKTVDYEKIVAVLVESTKEQQKQIEDLKKEIKELKK